MSLAPYAVVMGLADTAVQAFTMDALLSINHGQRPAIYVETVETLEPTDASEVQKVKYEVSLCRTRSPSCLIRPRGHRLTELQYMRQVKLSILDIGCRPDSAPATPDQLRAILEKAKRWE